MANYIVKTCTYCGQNFETTNALQLYCSTKCKYEQRKLNSNIIIPCYDRFCKECGNFFQTSNKSKVFCDENCRRKNYYKTKKGNNNLKQKECLNCNKLFNYSNNENFCSKLCEVEYENRKIRNELQNDLKEKIINGEDKEIVNILSDIVYLKIYEIITKSNFAEINNGIHNKTIDYWNLSDVPSNVREFVLERDNYKCQICESKNKLHIHHITKRCSGGDHNPDNLVTLCSSCHRYIETGDIDIASKGCLKNALKYYGINNDTNLITFSSIYNDLLKIQKLIGNDNKEEANNNINILLDKLENIF